MSDSDSPNTDKDSDLERWRRRIVGIGEELEKGNRLREKGRDVDTAMLLYRQIAAYEREISDRREKRHAPLG
jgi:hypothetical protein